MEKHYFGLILILSTSVLCAQNVGIGTITPTARLHINGNVKIDGLNTLEFGAGVAGKELNAGKIGYNAFGTNALAIVGAGTTTLNRAVYFFAEGGTTFTGPATIFGNTNLGGQLQFNGNAGTDGQALISNGELQPSWQSIAYGNQTRFATKFNSTVSTGAYPLGLTTQYNLNNSNISIGSHSITINKTGLYHLEASIQYATSSTTQPLFYAYLAGIYGAGTSYYLLREEIVPFADVSTINYRGNWHFGIDIHIIAPATISLNISSVNMNTAANIQGDFTGHLINE